MVRELEVVKIQLLVANNHLIICRNAHKTTDDANAADDNNHNTNNNNT